MATKQQKHDYLEEHLPYMLKMVRYTRRRMREHQSYLSFNAHFESFAVNARNLVKFLTNTDDGNFKARGFVENFKSPKGDITGLMTKLGQQVFHLSKNRPRSEGKFDTGDAKPVLDWIEENFNEFLRALPSDMRRIFDDKKAVPEELLIAFAPANQSTSTSSAIQMITSHTGYTGPGEPSPAEGE
jgi:hypothetical protein